MESYISCQKTDLVLLFPSSGHISMVLDWVAVTKTSCLARVTATYANRRSSSCRRRPYSSRWVRNSLFLSMESMPSIGRLRPVPYSSSARVSVSSNSLKASVGSAPWTASCGKRGRISASARTGAGTISAQVSHVLAFSVYSGGSHSPAAFVELTVLVSSAGLTLRESPWLLGKVLSLTSTTATASHCKPLA